MTRAATQRIHVGIEGVEEEAMRLSAGHLVGVLEVAALNLSLQGQGEQEALMASFRSFLNGLDFPVQLLVRVVPVDITRAVEDLEQRAAQLPGAVAALARDQAAFLRRLARNRTLLERRFFVALTVRPTALEGKRPGIRRSEPQAVEDLEAIRKLLAFRCEEVKDGIERCGLAARRLTGGELLQLFYACWNPEIARLQRIQQDLVQYVALAVRCQGSSGGAQ